MYQLNEAQIDLINRYVAQCEDRYDAEVCLLSEVCRHPGYSSQLEQGSRVHSTRGSLHYAMLLLYTSSREFHVRAEKIIDAVLRLQDTDPFGGTYGIWPWYLEEPLEKMSPPDWNWADFLGARLAQILHDHASTLSQTLVDRMRFALQHAAWCIFRRNVRLEYTNIAIMGGVVAAVAGELLGQSVLLDFGRERLKRVVDLLEYHGSFTEYNSPTYTMTAMEESERALHIAQDPHVRKWSEAIRFASWKIIAEHFHPGTQQWAGPQSRAYSNHISAGLARYLSEQTGASIRVHPTNVLPDAEPPSGIPSLACPESLRHRFVANRAEDFELRGRFIRREDPNAKPTRYSSDSLCIILPNRGKPRERYGDRVGTTWFSEVATLGSVSHEDLWTQRRTVLGMWRTPADPAVVLRVRFLHDGQDFASAFIRNQQSGRRVLSAITMLTDRGDTHPHFDHPANDVFEAADFRLRYELTGAGVDASQIDEMRFGLSAGDCKAVIHTAPGVFAGRNVRWETSFQPGCARVDAVCYQGARIGFDLFSLSTLVLAAGMEIVEPRHRASDELVAVQLVGDSWYQVRWSDTEMVVSMQADLYPG